MAFPAVTKAVAQVVAEAAFEAKKKVMKDFAEFLADKIEFDEEMQAYFDAFTATLSVEKVELPKESKKGSKKTDSDGVEKKKRAPSAYNLFIKEKMAEIKVEKPELKGKELMKAAIDAWNAEHPKSEEDKKPKGKKKAVETSASDSESEKKPKGKKAAPKKVEPEPEADAEADDE